MYYLVMVKKIVTAPSLLESRHKLQEEWDYMEDSTYSQSIGNHDYVACSKFDYSSQESCSLILCCKWHKKLFFKDNI